ncbi:MAG: acyl-ACP--UDP-N-acetylglucosamine O-acyltransferase [Bacteroidia bacterium]|nr:acyl-ACP--UDP-N-acetylglucosamine O-acyltransferase [Bacteroidia bacterium]
MHSPLAVISKQAKIGNHVTIGPFCVIHDDVVIGDNCNLHSHVVIYDGARIGNNNEFYPGAVVSAVPQDLKYKGETTYTFIGDNNTIREFVTINKGTVALGKTVIGDRNLLMAYVHVAHDCVVGSDCILANGVTLAGHITIDDFAIIGGLSAVHQFVHIGSHVMISGGSLVRKDVPPFTKSAHEPLAYVGLNVVGLRRRNFTNEQINNVQEIYRHLFVNGHTTAKAVKLIEEQIAQGEERDLILDFVKSSQRGLMKGYVSDSEA